MKLKKIISLSTVLLYSTSLTSCKTAATKSVGQVKPPKSSDSKCATPLELVRTDVDPATLQTTEVRHAERLFGDDQSLQITARMSPESDYIMYYRILSAKDSKSVREGAAPLNNVVISQLNAGSYNIHVASCVDDDRLSAETRAKYKGKPALGKAGFVKEQAIYCGPMVLATKYENNAKAPFVKKADKNKKLSKLLDAAFKKREDIFKDGIKFYEKAENYCEKHKPKLEQAGEGGDNGKVQATLAACKVAQHGKYGYALLVWNDYQEVLDKTIATVKAAPKQVPAKEALALAGGTGSSNSAGGCKTTVDDYENILTPDDDDSGIDYSNGPGAVDPDLTEEPTGSGGTGTDKPTDPIAGEGKTPTTGEPVSPEDQEALEEEMSKEEGGSGGGWGIAMLGVGSVVAVGVGGAGLLKETATFEGWTRSFDSVRETRRKAAYDQLKKPGGDPAAFKKTISDIEFEKLTDAEKYLTDQIKTEKEKLDKLSDPAAQTEVAKKIQDLEALQAKVTSEFPSRTPDDIGKFKSLTTAELGRMKLNVDADMLDALVKWNPASDPKIPDLVEKARPSTLEIKAKEALQGLQRFAPDAPTFYKGALIAGAVGALATVMLASASLAESEQDETKELLTSANRTGYSIVKHFRALTKIYEAMADNLSTTN